MTVDPEKDNTILCTYWGDDSGNRAFDILVDGKVIGSQVLNRNQPGEFFDLEYSIPKDLVRGKQEVVIKFQSKPNATAGGVFDLRVLLKK